MTAAYAPANYKAKAGIRNLGATLVTDHLTLYEARMPRLLEDKLRSTSGNYEGR